ncbi:protein phosphatase 2C domain-containing protein [Ilumatobacter nonamiensis]|uniref:protein phosphatase 2C domain-containing protein n=1 Tax=Ilumatobacter nonamiensis TaxID=467093 RepID=UPI000347AA9F|nr:PP2C family serine/threonine-protein phosphatase [Ilumatobacter nonamiensis]
MAELKWGAGTHPGQIRPDNEDHLFASDGVYVVADGMGGHEAGEVASALAVERIREALADDELAPTAERVVEAITSANGDIFRAAIANPAQSGMGTTVTVIAVIQDPMAGRGEPNIDDNDPLDPDRVTPIVPREQPEALVLANVGDSRTYLLRHGRLRRVTIDHSYVQELVSTGHITDDEARTHPRRNIITRALGIEPDVKVDWWTLPLVRGDRFLLCSDGLVDEVADTTIVSTLLEIEDPQEAANELIEQANTAGGRDNVTVIVVDVLEGDDPPDPTQELDLTPTWADDPDADVEAIDPDEPDADDGISSDEVAAAGLSRRERRRRGKAGEGDGTDVVPGDNDADPDDDDEAPGTKRRSRLLKAVIAFVVLALVVTVFALTARWARNDYFVDFDDSGGVVIYQGKPDGFLWFDPTAETAGNPSRDDLDEDSVDLVDARPTFSSFEDAETFVRELDLAETTPDTDATDDTSDATRTTDSATTGTTPAPGTTEAS